MKLFDLLSLATAVGLVVAIGGPTGCTVYDCESAECGGDEEDDGWCGDPDRSDDGASSSGTGSSSQGGTGAVTSSTGSSSQGGGGAGGDGAGGTGAGGSGEGGSGEGGGGTHCVKSCDCPQGEVCDEGLCRPRQPTPVSCSTDCDCPSGELCVDGFCA